jgi:hypothetical protein
MPKWFHFFVCTILLASSLGQVAANEVPAKVAENNEIISNISLLGLSASSTYSRTSVWSGIFTDFAGKAWNVSKFYKNKMIPLTAELTVGQSIERVDFVSKEPLLLFFVLHKLNFDLGYSSDLYTAQPYISWSPQVVYSQNKSITISIGVQHLLSIGGGVSERPCFDDFDREFHCGTGLPWITYENKSKDFSPTRSLFVSVQYVF